MEARTSLEQHTKEGRGRKKNRGRMIIGLGGIIILAFCLFFFTDLLEMTTGKEDGQNHQAAEPAKQQGQSSQDAGNNSVTQPQGKVVYLTFDDGPSEWSGKFLDMLDQHGIKATFFMQGSNLERSDWHSEVKRAVREGHYVGGHSMTHQYNKLYEEGQFIPEMKETLSLIHDLTGENPRLVRPPFGSSPGLVDEQLRDQIVEAGIKIWDWTIDSKDWDLKDHPQQIVENIKIATKNDIEVVLMHEMPQTLQALPEIIAFYQQEGYSFAVYDAAKHFHLNFLEDHRL
ncbi:polysaccharide deacetylase family protein [Paenibacillus sp. 1001270B_150601_E10]|uniref:polysaccharide deacetylase family protein n=1 Tax=Paenibacillus sp. 1001270B_150601_E10 TaxID=2787079 RepID=UPI001E52CF4E|nr:polysaccharide deacetylase family protein [Paenibacillus sp. 1001270B_150601_E10]